tara:strand:+ start:740 stop:1849 length:1110 start_codon:yes stop_codon:yes gene_type:complete
VGPRLINTEDEEQEINDARIQLKMGIPVTLFIKDKQSILFLHVPKCGGSSVDRMFKNSGYSAVLEMRGLSPQDCLIASPQHQTSENLKHMINMNKLDEIFIVVRNPYKRMISEYNWQFRDAELGEKPEINSWIIESIEKASRDASCADNHFRPSLDFMDTNFPCKIFRLEDGIEFVAEYFLRKHGSVDSIDIPIEKNAKKFLNNSTEPSLGDTTIETINQFYKYDFETFGYEMIKSPVNTRRATNEHKDDKYSTEVRIETARRWRTLTLNALHEKMQKELNTLHATILKPNKSIHSANHPKDKQHHGEIQKSIEVRFGEIQLKLVHELLKLNGLNSSRQEITPIAISSMIKQANQYRHQARLKNIIINN